MSSSAESTLARFCLPRAGLFFRRDRSRREASGPDDPARSGARFILVAWLPFALLAIAQRIILGRWEPLFLQPNVHIRLLMSGPLCLTAQVLLDRLTGRSLECFISGGFADDEQVARITESTTRWRDSPALELAVFTIAFVTASVTAWFGGAAGLASVEHGGLAAHGAPYAFYAFVALPLYLFVMLRWLVRWIIWCVALVRLAPHARRFPLAHPDGSAGLGHLTLPTRAFAVYVLANSCVMASTWSERIHLEGVHAATFIPQIVVAALVELVLAFAPLMVFTRSLFAARLQALMQYDELGRRYVERFERRWLTHAARDERLVGSPDIQSLADLANAYHNVTRMRLAPFEHLDVARVLAASVAPMGLLVIAELSLPVVLASLAKALVGRLTH